MSAGHPFAYICSMGSRPVFSHWYGKDMLRMRKFVSTKGIKQYIVLS